ncbi:MAG TPA: hypothetical protein DIW47_09130 [Bacteroidetes bacterium]|nr:hypothetical protein [Bacteroidota bacterium]
MKPFSLFLFAAFLTLFVSGCKKDESPENIIGYVSEAGTGRRIAGVSIFLVALEYGSWPRMVVMAKAKTDKNGEFVIDNIRHEEIYRHFLAAQGSSDYYELDFTRNVSENVIEETTQRMDFTLVRKAKLGVRFLNVHGGDECVVSSKKETINWYYNLIPDSTVTLAVEGFLENKIYCSCWNGGANSRHDTSLYIEPFRQDTLKVYY